MADKTFAIRLEIENGELVVRGLENIGAAGEKAGQKIKRATENEASPGMRALTAASAETSKAMDTFASRLGPLGNVLRSFGPTGLVMASAIGGVVALGAGLRATLKDMDNLSDASQRLKVTAETLQSLRLSSREAGFEPEQADQAVQSLRDARLTALKGLHGSERAQQAFTSLGISNADLQKLDTMEKLLTAVAHGLNEIDAEGTRAGVADALGLSPLYDMLVNLKGAIEDVNKSNLDLARIVSNDVVKAGGEANDQFEEIWTRLTSALTPAFVAFGETVLPVFKGLNSVVLLVIGALDELIGKTSAGSGLIYDLAKQAQALNDVSATSGSKVTASTLTEKDRADLRRQKPRAGYEEITVTGLSREAYQAQKEAQRETEALAKSAAKAADALDEVTIARKDWRKDPSSFGRMQDTEERISEHASKDVQRQTDSLDDKFQSDFKVTQSARDAWREAFSGFVKDLRSGDFKDAFGDLFQGIEDRMLQRITDQLSDVIFDAVGPDTMKALFAPAEAAQGVFAAATQVATASLSTMTASALTAAAAMQTIAASSGSGIGGGFLGGVASAIFGGLGGGPNIGGAYVTGWADGGYTGSGGRKQRAGIVHKGEYVMNQDAVAKWGVAGMDALAEGRTPFDPVTALQQVSQPARSTSPRGVVVHMHNNGQPMEARTETSQDANGDTRIDHFFEPIIEQTVNQGFSRGRFDKAQRARTGLRPQIMKR